MGKEVAVSLYPSLTGPSASLTRLHYLQLANEVEVVLLCRKKKYINDLSKATGVNLLENLLYKVPKTII